MLKFVFITSLLSFSLLACISKEDSQSKSFIYHKFDTSNYCKYTWKIGEYSFQNSLVNRIGIPEGYIRVNVPQESFANWLRHLPLKTNSSPVMLYNGSLKSRQDVHIAVIDIDPGNEDLQQCADACMRLKAEYHYSRGENTKIHFKFTSGDNAQWSQWSQGYRPEINGNKVSWKKKTPIDTSYKNFKSYLTTVFRYAGTQSLSNELLTIPKNQIQAGDIFIQGGFPGHAVIVMDVVENTKTKEKLFLLAQSYMPAQEIHILKNFNDDSISPWYSINFIDELNTPEWTFEGNCLKRFK